MCSRAVCAASARGRGFCGTYPSEPRRSTSPASGSCSPASTLRRLVLPAPLRPTSPTLSPAATLKLASDKTRRAAMSMARLRTWSTSPDVTHTAGRRLVFIITGGGHMKRFLFVIALFFGILVAAAACGGGSGAGSTSGGAPTYRDGTTSSGGAGSGTTAPIKGAPAPGGPATITNPGGDVVPPIQGPPALRHAQLSTSVKSGSFDSSLASVRSLVELEQGYVSGTDAQANPITNDQIRTGVISFMVPASKFDETIDALSKMGKVQTEHISGNDVSLQYVDLHSRLANEEAQRDAMLALLAKAQTVEQIILVQNQLGQITGQIEQLKGQVQYIEHNVAFSTISVQLTEAGAPVTVPSSDSWGFASALSDAAHNFMTTINYLVTGLGAVGPVLILLGLGYLLWRRAGRPGWRHA